MKRGTGLAVTFLVGLVAVGLAVGGVNRNWSTHSNGSEEVPVRDSQGQAQAIFHLSEDGTELDFKLIASNIVDVTQSHIHCGLPGVNGPVVVFLYGLGPTVSPNGVLSEGTITNADVIPRLDSAALLAWRMDSRMTSLLKLSFDTMSAADMASSSRSDC